MARSAVYGRCSLGPLTSRLSIQRQASCSLLTASDFGIEYLRLARISAEPDVLADGCESCLVRLVARHEAGDCGPELWGVVCLA